jgi:hypothetical protein
VVHSRGRRFRVWDLDAFLQALERMAVGTQQHLEEANAIPGHGTLQVSHRRLPKFIVYISRTYAALILAKLQIR